MDNFKAIRIIEREKKRFLDNYIDFSGTSEAYDIAIEALKQQVELEQLRKDYDQITDNLKIALENEKNLNQQLMGRLDAYRSIMDRLLEIIDKQSSRVEVSKDA
jgi:hypothetical protein